MEIKNHLLSGRNINKMVKSPNQSGEFKSGDLDTVIMHYTTGGSARPAINTLTNPRVKASAHVVIDRDGSITQLIPFNKIAWHAGKSFYKGRSGFNKYSIGIEMVNAGHLSKSGNIFRAWYGEAFNPSDVQEAIHRNHTKAKYWHVYTQEQLDSVRDLCGLLIDKYDITQILGHEEIAPKRKSDPGPAFPLDKFRDALFSGGRDDDGDLDLPESGRVTANSLNIRSKPKSDSTRVAKSLPKGKKVSILDEHNGWYKVAVEVEGWVYGKYVQYE